MLSGMVGGVECGSSNVLLTNIHVTVGIGRRGKQPVVANGSCA